VTLFHCTFELKNEVESKELGKAVRCPACTSQCVWKDGIRKTAYGDVQRYLCRDCGYRFSNSKVLPHVGQSKKIVNKPFEHRFHCQVGAAPVLRRAKNLVEVVKPLKEGPAGATKQDAKGKIVEFAWYMKKQGYAETTIHLYSTTLQLLVKRGANIFDPESVKEVIAKQKWGESRKHNAIASYTLFLKTHGKTWEPPRCNVTRKLPFIPTESELDALIAGCGKKTSAFLQLLKETAMRSGEANKLRWIDVDVENKTITLNYPEKNSLPRIFKVSSKLIGMLNSLPKKSARIFGDGPTWHRKVTFYKSRKILAKKLKNPRLLRISFHTFRHWKATMLYHQTKDILYVKEFLGHKKIENTLLYVQLAESIFKEINDEFTVKVAKTPKEIKQLLEVGFEYVCEKDGLMFFRKRK